MAPTGECPNTKGSIDTSMDELPAEIPDVADAVLELFDDICRSLRIIYFLTAGTCLGFYRDKNYIRGDNDLDMRVMCTDEQFDSLLDALREAGFAPALEPGYERMHFRKDGILCDIKRAVGTEFEFDTVYHNGWPYRIPHPVEDYLRRVYGEDWTTPQWKLRKSRPE